ncbi:MAG: hypothetical protein IJE43_21435, partial [Alphaproteobacteria bacterium]|nr:hypothetical protein [Alphaproteobacteria bacterium]
YYQCHDAAFCLPIFHTFPEDPDMPYFSTSLSVFIERRMYLIVKQQSILSKVYTYLPENVSLCH